RPLTTVSTISDLNSWDANRCPVHDGGAVIDCDLRLAAPPVSALREHLDGHWREAVAERGLRSLEPSYQAPGGLPRVPAPVDGVQVAVVHPVAALEALHGEDLVAALARALNDWLRAEWLDRDPRLRGSITVAPQSVEHAVAECERL